MPPSASCSRDRQTPNSALGCDIRATRATSSEQHRKGVAHLIAVSPEPIAISIVILVLEAYGDPIVLDRPVNLSELGT